MGSRLSWGQKLTETVHTHFCPTTGNSLIVRDFLSVGVTDLETGALGPQFPGPASTPTAKQDMLVPPSPRDLAWASVRPASQLRDLGWGCPGSAHCRSVAACSELLSL